MSTSINFGDRGGNAAVIEIDTRNHNQLVREFDKQLDVRKHNRMELGRIARELKSLHLMRGQREKGKGWEAFLGDRGLSRSTVDEWIVDYELSIGARERQSVLPESGRTNSENKPCSDPLNGHDRTGPNSDPLADEEWPSLEPEQDIANVVPRLSLLDTPQGRSDWLFKNALDVFERANRASGQALDEWDQAASRVRKVLGSYKKDEVDNPNADFSPIAVEEED